MNDLPSHAPESVTRGFVEVPITGNFLFRNPLKGEARTVLVGFHGYAENAEIQFERLLTIPGSDKDLLCSIQALHPFYRTKTGEVVASWMTRFQREQAIIENRCFVDRVLDKLRERVPDHVPLVWSDFHKGLRWLTARSQVNDIDLPRWSYWVATSLRIWLRVRNRFSRQFFWVEGTGTVFIPPNSSRRIYGVSNPVEQKSYPVSSKEGTNGTRSLQGGWGNGSPTFWDRGEASLLEAKCD